MVGGRAPGRLDIARDYVQKARSLQRDLHVSMAPFAHLGRGHRAGRYPALQSHRELPPLLPSAQGPHVQEWRPAPYPAHEHLRVTRLAKSQDQFDSMVTLQKRGIPQPDSARRLGVTTRTVQDWKKRGLCPETTQRQKRRSRVDLYAAYVLSREKQGCRNMTMLWKETRECGVPGSIRLLYRFLEDAQTGIRGVAHLDGPQSCLCSRSGLAHCPLL
jgi:ribosomal protein L19